MNLLKSKPFYIVLFLIALICFSGYSYIYQPHKNIESSKAEFKGDTKEFLKKMKNNVTIWLDKTIVLTGTISQADKNGIILDNIIYCQFKNIENSKLSTHTKITLKGNIIGYDDLLEEVKLNQCIVQKQKP